jgi:hypothetical protein
LGLLIDTPTEIKIGGHVISLRSPKAPPLVLSPRERCPGDTLAGAFSFARSDCAIAMGFAALNPFYA